MSCKKKGKKGCNPLARSPLCHALIFVYPCTSKYMCMYVCMYVCKYACMHIRNVTLYVCMYVCMYVCIYT